MPASDEYDSPWKTTIELYFKEFMAFFFPDAHTQIDWNIAPEFLDKELQQIAREAELGLGYADILAKAWLTNGEECWIVIHVEVQGTQEANFDERMYVYNYRAYDRHRKRVASLAILTDEHPNWRPGTFSYTLFGCNVSMSFPTVKLSDFKARWEELENSTNPFAVVVMAHLKTQETRKDSEARFMSMRILLELITERGYLKNEFRDLLRVIDWIMRLPKEYEARINALQLAAEEKYAMKYMTFLDKRDMERERVATWHDAIMNLLLNIGPIPHELEARLRAVKDVARLPDLHKAASLAKSLTEFEAALQE